MGLNVGQFLAIALIIILVVGLIVFGVYVGILVKDNHSTEEVIIPVLGPPTMTSVTVSTSEVGIPEDGATYCGLVTPENRLIVASDVSENDLLLFTQSGSSDSSFTKTILDSPAVLGSDATILGYDTTVSVIYNRNLFDPFDNTYYMKSTDFGSTFTTPISKVTQRSTSVFSTDLDVQSKLLIRSESQSMPSGDRNSFLSASPYGDGAWTMNGVYAVDFVTNVFTLSISSERVVVVYSDDDNKIYCNVSDDSGATWMDTAGVLVHDQGTEYKLAVCVSQEGNLYVYFNDQANPTSVFCMVSTDAKSITSGLATFGNQTTIDTGISTDNDVNLSATIWAGLPVVFYATGALETPGRLRYVRTLVDGLNPSFESPVTSADANDALMSLGRGSTSEDGFYTIMPFLSSVAPGELRMVTLEKSS